MRVTHELNARQLVVLGWIADGCPGDDRPGTAFKVTARALQDRRLVTVDRRGGAWAVTVTDAGRFYLQHGRHPAAPEGSEPDRRQSVRRESSTTAVSVRAVGPDTAYGRALRVTGSPAPASKPSRSPTEQLVADVVAAGGRLELQPDQDRRYEWQYQTRELVRHANRHGKTPAGKRLRLERVRDEHRPHHDSYVVVLEEGPAGTDAPLQPVPVPDDVHRYHPVVSQLRKAKKLPSTQATHRRWRILHGLAVEAEHRGFTVTGQAGQMFFSREGEIVPVTVYEETDRLEHVPTARELAAQRRDSWFRMPTHDTVPSGRLRLDLGGLHSSERRSFWADRSRWRLEDKLPEALREVAVRIDELRTKREAQVRAEAAYQEAVEQERKRARERAGESHRRQIVDKELQAWRQAAELRAYAADLSRRIAEAEGDGENGSASTDAARRWLTWLEDHARKLDPLTELPNWPVAPALPSWELEKFMRHVPRPLEMSYRPPMS